METPVITFDDWYLYIDVHISGQTYIGPCSGEQTLLKSELSVGLRVFPAKAWRSIYICHQHLWSGCWPVAVMGPEQGTRTSTGFCRGFTTWTVVQLDLLGIPKLVFLAAKPGLRPKHRQWQKGWDSARCLLWSQFGVNLAVDLNAEKFGASMTNRKLCLIKHQDFNLHPCSKSTHPMEKNQAGDFRLEVTTSREVVTERESLWVSCRSEIPREASKVPKTLSRLLFVSLEKFSSPRGYSDHGKGHVFYSSAVSCKYVGPGTLRLNWGALGALRWGHWDLPPLLLVLISCRNQWRVGSFGGIPPYGCSCDLLWSAQHHSTGPILVAGSCAAVWDPGEAPRCLHGVRAVLLLAWPCFSLATSYS